MTNYREILRLRSLGLNNTEIAASMGGSRNTVAGVLRRAEACGLAHSLLAEMSDKQIAETLFPATASKPTYKMPDYEYVHWKGLGPHAASVAQKHLSHSILGTGSDFGSGKTYLACALGMAAVRNFFPVKYVRLPELLPDLAIARVNGTYRKVVQQYAKPVLLIVDEWLLYSLKESEARDLLEIADARYKKASTILCSQFDVPGWCDKIGDPLIADAICDRVVHNAHRIVIDCKESMRKRFGMIPESQA